METHHLYQIAIFVNCETDPHGEIEQLLVAATCHLEAERLGKKCVESMNKHGHGRQYRYCNAEHIDSVENAENDAFRVQLVKE